mgnify:FL=1
MSNKAKNKDFVNIEKSLYRKDKCLDIENICDIVPDLLKAFAIQFFFLHIK